MCRKRSDRSRRASRNRRRYLQLLLVTALLALTVLTGCKTTAAEPGIDTAGIIKAMMPELPELPAWPELHWQLEDNGRYSLSETDVDRILDYWENAIPHYKYEMEIYKKAAEIIIDHL